MLGLVDTSQTPALGAMELVPSCSAAVLLPIIHQHVRPGSIMWSDEWAAYRRVQQLPPVTQHQTVNHSIEFVNPTTGVHTQNLESYWNRVKTKFKRMKGVQESMLSSYLDEFGVSAMGVLDPLHCRICAEILLWLTLCEHNSY